jgi:hypothetical protein
MKIANRCPACDGTELEKTPAILMPYIAKRVFGWDCIRTEDSTVYSICNTVHCVSCGMLFCDIRFDPDENERLYANYWKGEAVEMREKYEQNWGDRNWAIQSGLERIPAIEWFLEPRLKFPVDILDWGGDTGENTPFKDRSKRVDIYEVGSNPVVWGKRVDVPEPPYDLIILSNVMEHVSYPSELLSDILRYMGKALLYIEIPYVPSEFKHKLYWHEHINFFTEEAVKRLLSRMGLEIVSSKHIPPYYQIACKTK